MSTASTPADAWVPRRRSVAPPRLAARQRASRVTAALICTAILLTLLILG